MKNNKELPPDFDKIAEEFSQEAKEKIVILLDMIMDKSDEILRGAHGAALQGCVWEYVAIILLGRCLAILREKGYGRAEDLFIEKVINDAKKVSLQQKIVREH